MKTLAFLLLLVTTVAAAEKAAPLIVVEELASPGGRGSLGASFAKTPQGEFWLSWVEPAPPAPGAPVAAAPAGHKHGSAPAGGPNTLRFAAWQGPAKGWGSPRTIAVGHGVPTSSADFPQVVINGEGRAFAVWPNGQGGAFTESADQGVTWSAPAAWAAGGQTVEKFSFVRLSDGRVLAAWLDGRARPNGVGPQQLFARILGGGAAADVQVDASVCDCCPTTLAAFPDGGAILAYRGRTAEEVRDIRVNRFHGDTWGEPRPLNHDDWRIAACPINGPRLATDGGRVAAAWFTAADNDPRVLASFSPDAGGRFLMPLRIDRGHPAGKVDTVILSDGALLVSWVENDGSVWLRRVTPDFSLTNPVALAPAGATSTKTVPRLALHRDYQGGKSTAQLLAAFATDGAPLRTLLITVPEGELLEHENDCGCSPSPEQLRGFPIRGSIAQVSSQPGVVRIKQAGLAGVFSAGERDFKIAPGLVSATAAGRSFLGRVEERDGDWWLFDLRWLGPPAAGSSGRE